MNVSKILSGDLWAYKFEGHWIGIFIHFAFSLFHLPASSLCKILASIIWGFGFGFDFESTWFLWGSRKTRTLPTGKSLTEKPVCYSDQVFTQVYHSKDNTENHRFTHRKEW